MTRAAWPAWLLPAVIAGAATLVIVSVVGLFIDDDPAQPAGLPRHRVASIAPLSAPVTTPPTAVTPTRFRLASDGLGAVRFGQPPEQVIALLTDQFGTPDEDRSQACDGGKHARWVRWAGLSAVFSTTAFIGFIDGVHYPPGRPPLDLATAAGLVPGNGVERLHALYGQVPIREQPSQPGRPATQLFTISDTQTGKKLSGVIEDEGSETVVSTVFAGKLC